MKRRILTLLLALLLLPAPRARAVMTDVSPKDTPGVYYIMTGEGGSLLPRTRVYDGQFADVAAEAWYCPYVAASYEYGLLEGRDGGFAPEANVTLAELLTLSARLRAAYAGETIPAAQGGAWYEPYVAYLRERELLDETLPAYDAVATRAQLAAVFASSLPEECFDARNALLVTDAYASGDYIADVDEYTPYQPQILWLYRQGLLVGADAAGSYLPAAPTTRAEVAALVTRMADPALRLTPEWQVRPAWSAAGTTLADLIDAPAESELDGSVQDSAVQDALVRRMLAAGENTIDLSIPARTDVQSLAGAFVERVKSYCEQMYNALECTYGKRGGSATLRFSASCCTDEELARLREETMARAVEVHDALWETGSLTADMSQYERARVYYIWLCEHCAYDFDAVNSDSSASHIAHSALVDGKAVCDGYTGAYNLFLKLEGIECRALVNDSHIWTVAALDGTEYHIDVTWGDQDSGIDWSFFAMSESASRRAHPW